mmetsp:Transcript_29057/g.68300  ORF Transcript_29057/g.68300 Transcript_29057/m.68300 type:complete len:531 (-) Transcript_29057:120-1712(-)
MTSTFADDKTSMDGTMSPKEIEQEDAISTWTTDSSCGSDSECEQQDEPQSDAFPTGLKRRRGTGAAAAAAVAAAASSSSTVIRPEEVVDSDPTARTDPLRSKYNRKSSTKKQTITATGNANGDANGNANGKPYTLARWIEFFVGCVFFFVPIPLVVCQIVACTLWELADQATFKLTNLGTAFNEWCDPYYKRLVQHPKDTFIVNTTIWLGIVLPAYFVMEAIAQAESIRQGNGLIWWRAALYNIFRIGPMYRHFMFVYVLCHKEAHSYGKLFAMPYRKYLGLQYVYNYFIGFFHGVLPGPFTESHIYNHHKYDNDSDDVYSTGAYPRDSFGHFLRYVYIWFLYALNISSIFKFLEEGKAARAYRCIGGTLYYAAGVGLCAKLVSPTFAAFYIVYPLIEGNILLGAVNYTWHAFIDPNDHDNDYVNSVTILNGLNFTLNEEYHVVHHQHGGVHWSRNKELYEKHIDEYKKHTATVFKDCNLFVIWGMIVAKDYDGLVDNFVQYEEDESKKLSREELAQLLKERLQCTTWSY